MLSTHAHHVHARMMRKFVSTSAWPNPVASVPVIDLGVHKAQTSVKTYVNRLSSRNQVLAMVIVTNLVGCIVAF